MGKEGSVAPKERVNITYKPAIGNAKEEVELPLKLLMLGDYTMRPDPRPLEDRKPINVDKDNFQKVMSEQKLALNFGVKDKLGENEDNELNVNLKFRRLSDMEPEAIANQVPELKKLLDLRAALTSLKGPARQREGVPQQDPAAPGRSSAAQQARQRARPQEGRGVIDGY
jgi:type VI secretion system protein ImpB